MCIRDRYYDSLKNNFFVTDVEDDSDESLEVLRNLLAKIMMEIIQKGYGYEHKAVSYTHLRAGDGNSRGRMD